jgi:hypothetical protein
MFQIEPTLLVWSIRISMQVESNHPEGEKQLFEIKSD